MSESLPLGTAVSATATDWSPIADVKDSRRVVVLRPPGSVLTGLLAHLLRLPGYWDLLRTLTVHRVKVRYKQSLLGWAWAVRKGALEWV